MAIDAPQITDCFNSPLQEFIISHHTATLQFTFDKTATAFDFARSVADRLYWLDDHYVQPFYA